MEETGSWHVLANSMLLEPPPPYQSFQKPCSLAPGLAKKKLGSRNSGRSEKDEDSGAAKGKGKPKGNGKPQKQKEKETGGEASRRSGA